MITPHSLKALDTLDAMNADPVQWGPCPVEWVWKVMPVPTKVRCDACPDARRGTPCATCRGQRTVTRLVEREVLVGRLVWPVGTCFPSRFWDGSRYCCELCAKTITHSLLVPVLGATRDGYPVGMYVGSDCARKMLGVAYSQDFSLVSRENATVMRDTNRQTEAEREAAKAKKIAKQEALAALLAAGDPLGRPLTDDGRLQRDLLERQAEAGLVAAGLPGDASEYTQKNMSEVHLYVDRSYGISGIRHNATFKITSKGASLTTWAPGAPTETVLWKDPTARNARVALDAAIASYKAHLG
jgi:hypothetical protein